MNLGPPTSTMRITTNPPNKRPDWGGIYSGYKAALRDNPMSAANQLLQKQEQIKDRENPGFYSSYLDTDMQNDIADQQAALDQKMKDENFRKSFNLGKTFTGVTMPSGLPFGGIAGTMAKRSDDAEIWWHATNQAFNKIKKGEYHAGNLEQALHRITNRKGKLPEGTAIYPMEIDGNKFPRVRDITQWDSNGLLRELTETNTLSPEAITKLEGKLFHLPGNTDKVEAKRVDAIYKALKEEGIDGLRYMNRHEGSMGKDSILVTNQETIKPFRDHFVGLGAEDVVPEQMAGNADLGMILNMYMNKGGAPIVPKPKKLFRQMRKPDIPPSDSPLIDSIMSDFF